jgi:hypothetical protein
MGLCANARMLEFAYSLTRVTPLNKKDVLCRQMGVKIWETNAAHFFQESKVSCFSNLECIFFCFRL